MSGGGVYGEDCYDGGGVYGADMGIGGPLPPVVITKIERRQSKEECKLQQRSTPKDNTATSTAKSSRKQSKDTTMAADLEKAYLISAANECHSGEEVVITASENTGAAQVPVQPPPTTTTTITTKNHHHPHNQAKTTKFSLNDTHIDEEKPLKSTTSNDHGQQQNHHQQQQSNITSTNSGYSMTATTPRKPAFNPLHVILKDKNKYHTTEYI